LVTTWRGRFISLEGGEGVGKSTQVQALAAALRDRGIQVVVTREPGGSNQAERIRELLLSPDESWSPESEALLFAAARADHIACRIAPALELGQWVVCDRFVDSSMAYQGGAGCLGIEAVRAINVFAIGKFFPDRTLVLQTEEGTARARARDHDESDRIGGRPEEYHRRVDAAFRLIAAEEPERVRLVDGSGSPKDVTERLLDAIADLLP
jgi:dTMP kinase